MSTDSLTKYEHESIRRFVQAAADEGYLGGDVLDFGSGRQPYREIVLKAGGQYHPFDRVKHPASISARDYGFSEPLQQEWSAILFNQVVQYIPDVPPVLVGMRQALTAQGGALVMTYPTNWPEVEAEDLHRFTKAGMERLLVEAGFTIERHERRAYVFDPWIDSAPGKRHGLRGIEFALGYGVIARA